MVEWTPDPVPVEIKEWQTVMQFLQMLPAEAPGSLPMVTEAQIIGMI